MSYRSGMQVRGSLTVFFALTMMTMISMVFSLLELIHYKAMLGQSRIAAEAAIDSAFADYNRLLWDEFGILAIDSGYCSDSPSIALLESRMTSYAAVNASPEAKGANLYRMQCGSCTVSEYGLATDDEGLPALKEAAIYAGSRVGVQVIDALKESVSEAEKAESQQKTVEDYLKEADDASKDAKELASGQIAADADGASETGVKLPEKPPKDPPDNPVETIVKLKDKSVLAQVMGSDMKISEKKLLMDDPPSSRTLAGGNTSEPVSFGLSDRLLFADYAATYLGYFGKPQDHPGLSYECEYLLCGRDSDEKNLEGMVERLLLSREAENMASIVSDPAKMSSALELATAILGWTLNEALVTALQYGIAAAWAYLESVLDVRLLLSGGRVAMVKTPEQWTSRLEAFATYFPVEQKAIESESGLNYKDYMLIFLGLTFTKNLGLRFLDILENSLRSCEDYSQVRVDNLIFSMKVECDFEARPLFFSLIPTADRDFSGYSFKLTQGMSYIT